MKPKFHIVKDTSKSLREKCLPVEEPISEEAISFVNDLAEYLILSQDEKYREKYGLREGVGLAAPQVGKNIKACVVHYSEKDEDGNEIIIDHRLINPKIISESVKLTYLSGGEGCLSVDDDHKGYVYRNYKIIVSAYDATKREKVHITARGYEAIVLQHEIDHLSGILYYDRIDKNNPFKEIEGAVRL